MAETSDEDATRVVRMGHGLPQAPADVPNPDAVVEVNLTGNKLESCASLAAFPNLHTLILDKNQITSINELPELPLLETLWLNNNLLTDIQETLKILGERCPKLSYLSLLRNPLCPDMYADDRLAARYDMYRLIVLFKLPKLECLDADDVQPAERTSAAAQGPLLFQSARVVPLPSASVAGSAASAGQPTSAHASKRSVQPKKAGEQPRAAAFLGRGQIKYDGRQSEGNRFIVNDDL